MGKNKNESNSIVIECECGTHLLKAQSETDYCNDNFNQSIHLAMFSYGNQNTNFFNRCKIGFNYLLSGKMYSDQLCLNTNEALKLATFLNENIKNIK